MRLPARLPVLLLLVAPPLLASAQDPEPLLRVPGAVPTRGGGAHVEGELLVGWQAGADPGAVQDEVVAAGGFVRRSNPRLRLLVVDLPEGTRAEDWLGRYAGLPGVRYAELNGIGMGGLIAPPNDTGFSDQWHLENTASNDGTPGADLEALAAWDIEKGDASVVLAILDSGIDFNNPDFVGRTLQGFDFVNNDGDASADHDHGILVSGLAMASADNAFGVAGLDRECTQLPVKVLNAFNGGTVLWLVDGLDYCAQQQPDVVSMSLIDYPAANSIADALQSCRTAGCILVACAGNGGTGNADVSWPGASPLTISIGATDPDDVRAGFSATGAALDFVAPGEDTVTIDAGGANGTEDFSGCSAATPLAAATVSLLKAQDPTLTHDEAFALLLAGAEDGVGGSEDKVGRDDHYGWGRLNTRGALDPLYDRYCSPAVPNSTGLYAVITASGSRVVTDNDLRLTASRLPKNSPGYFLGSLTQGFVPLPPGSEGNLCLGGQIARFAGQVKNSGSSGSFKATIDLTAIPTHGAVQPGESWNFQTWHRDMNPGATSNFTDAITLPFE